MSNIYNIKAELLDIFSELEENGGELTPELEQQLAITQEEATNKIRSYTKVIQSLKNDLNAIDEEVGRLKVLKDSKKKTIEKITAIIIDAVDLFGDTNKSGNKFVDFADGKVTIRNSTAVDVDKDNIDGIVSSFNSIISNLMFTNQLKIVDGVDVNLLKQVASEYKEYVNGEELNKPINFTEDDLKAFDGEIVFKANFANLLNGPYFKALKEIIEVIGKPELIPSINKTQIKGLLSDTNNNISIGRLVHNQGITIK